MNLLGKGQDTDIQTRIIMTLGELGFHDDELSIAREFFDFSRELDLSLLRSITQRPLKNPKNGNSTRSTLMLYSDLLRLPKERSNDITDRYILFLDAAGGNTIGQFVPLCSFFYYSFSQPEIKRLRQALEICYSPKDVQAKLLSLFVYAARTEGLYINNSLVEAAVRDPRDFYKAGKRFCVEPESATRENLYALAMAYAKEDDFTADELAEMEACMLTHDQKLTDHYTGELDNMVLKLFLASNSSSRLRQRLEQRLMHHYEFLLSSLLQFIPSGYFQQHMELLAAAGENAENMTIEKMIKRTVKSAVSSDAFRRHDTSCQARNSYHFLELLSQKYTEHYLTVMTANEAVGTGPRWGYLFNYYGDLMQILERTVPGAKETYGLNAEKEMVDLTIHREVMDVKNTVRKEVMDYLKGESGLDSLELLRGELKLQRNESCHEERMLCQLKVIPDFYQRYVAYKILQNPAYVKNYLHDRFRTDTDGAEEMKVVLRAAAAAGVPLADRLSLFEQVYALNDYWEDKRLAITGAVVELMTEHCSLYDEQYAAECPSREIVTRCCYARYLEQTNTDQKNKTRLLDLCADSSKEVRRTVIDLLGRHRELEPEVIAMLSAKKQTLREAAVEIIALWGTGSYQDLLKQAAETEKSTKLADKIRALLSASAPVSESGETLFSPVLFIEEIHKGGRNKKLAWLFQTPMPPVHMKNGATADEKYLQALLLCYSTMPVPGRNENAFLLAAELHEDELHRYAAEVFSRWYSAGAEAKTKWALYFAVIHGGDAMVEAALKCVKDWAENMRGAIASEAVRAMALNGSSFALMTVDNLAHKFKQKQVKKAAAEAMENAAEALGLTADELSDRIVPDLGFHEDREREFDYGGRSFKVYLTPRLELEVLDENGKKLKTLPSPGKKDDEVLAKQAYTDFKSLKKQLKAVVSIQKLRLETALLADRRWEKADWEALFVKNPVMHSFAIGLIWAAYSGEEVTTFRYMEDGSFNTADEDEFILPENCQIGLVHPIELDAETLSVWQEQLSDYEIVQPIEQLDRKLYRPEAAEAGKLDLERFSGRSLNALTLLGRATKLGWSKGSAQDGGMFYVFYREDVTARTKTPEGSFQLSGNAAELHFSGTYIAVEDEPVTIESVRFYRPGTIEHGSYVYDEADNQKAIPLDRIPPRYFSEIILQLEAITKE